MNTDPVIRYQPDAQPPGRTAEASAVQGELAEAMLAAWGAELLAAPDGELSVADMELVAAHAERRLGEAARAKFILRLETEPALAEALADHLLLMRELEPEAALGCAPAAIAATLPEVAVSRPAAASTATRVADDPAVGAAGAFGGLVALACVALFAYGLSHMDPSSLELALGVTGMLLGTLYIVHGVTRLTGRVGTAAALCVAAIIGCVSQADADLQLTAMSVMGMLLGIMYVTLGATLAPIRAEASRRRD